MRRKTLVSNQTQLEETAFLLKSMVVPLPGITMRRLGIVWHGNMLKQKAFSHLHAAAALVLVQAAAYEGQQSYGSKHAYERQKDSMLKRSSWLKDCVCYKCSKKNHFKKEYHSVRK